MIKRAVVVFNLGGPDNPNAVQPFLFNLFNDAAIIDLPNPFRWLIAKIISARRAPIAKEIYAEIGGKSPLLDLTQKQAIALEANLNRNKNPRVRVISSNIVQNYLMGVKLPNSFNQTIEHFKNYKDCVLIFIRDTNLKSVSHTLRDYKSNKFYKKGQDKLIRNYGIGAQIIKTLNIKNMILVTRSKKKVVGLDGYGIKITKQEILK